MKKISKLEEIENRKHTITGNRTEVLFDLYELEWGDDFIAFCETYDFQSFDVMNACYECGCEFDYACDTLTEHGIKREYIITDTLTFYFENDQFTRLTKRYNVLDEMRVKYNLPF